MNDFAHYMLDHYGACALERCACLGPGVRWLGRECPNWRPAGVTSLEELIAHVQAGARTKVAEAAGFEPAVPGGTAV